MCIGVALIVPLTCSKRLADSPSDIGFGITSPSYGKTHYQESIFVGYRHFEKSQTETLFPFGYGLSYTTFAFSDVSVSSVSAEGDFEVSFKVKNTGKIAGKEVAQIYIRDVESSLGRPIKELKAFEKVALEAGEEKTVTVKLDKDALKFWDDSRKYWKAEAGEFEVLVGNSSDNVPLKTSVKLEKTLTWLGL
jgi:beta-glucosidase